MQNDRTKLLGDVAGYYSEKLVRFGETPQGVDWNGDESQVLRFEQLCKIIGSHEAFSLNDLGCGYGALLDYLSESCNLSSYLGVDVSEDMVRAARERFTGRKSVRFITSAAPDRVADYCVASGIFNVRLDRKDSEWIDYLHATLDVLDRRSRFGFAFNCLTSYSDADKMKDHLFYANPCAVFDHCKRHYSRNVAVLHDYGLYEFTILVRKV